MAAAQKNKRKHAKPNPRREPSASGAQRQPKFTRRTPAEYAFLTAKGHERCFKCGAKGHAKDTCAYNKKDPAALEKADELLEKVLAEARKNGHLKD